MSNAHGWQSSVDNPTLYDSNAPKTAPKKQYKIKLSVRSGKDVPDGHWNPPLWSHRVPDFKKHEKKKYTGLRAWVHFILSLCISYPDLIKFHYFADNSQEGMMKHQMRGATQAQHSMTLWNNSNRSNRYLSWSQENAFDHHPNCTHSWAVCLLGPAPRQTGSGTISFHPTFGSFTLLEPVSH